MRLQPRTFAAKRPRGLLQRRHLAVGLAVLSGVIGSLGCVPGVIPAGHVVFEPKVPSSPSSRRSPETRSTVSPTTASQTPNNRLQASVTGPVPISGRGAYERRLHTDRPAADEDEILVEFGGSNLVSLGRVGWRRKIRPHIAIGAGGTVGGSYSIPTNVHSGASARPTSGLVSAVADVEFATGFRSGRYELSFATRAGVGAGVAWARRVISDYDGAVVATGEAEPAGAYAIFSSSSTFSQAVLLTDRTRITFPVYGQISLAGPNSPLGVFAALGFGGGVGYMVSF